MPGHFNCSRKPSEWPSNETILTISRFWHAIIELQSVKLASDPSRHDFIWSNEISSSQSIGISIMNIILLGLMKKDRISLSKSDRLLIFTTYYDGTIQS
jgi:hypothetical protein